MYLLAAKPEVLRIHRMDGETWLHKSSSNLHMWQVHVLPSISVNKIIKKESPDHSPKQISGYMRISAIDSDPRACWWCSISNSHILADEFLLSLHFLLQSIISESCKIFVCECMCTHAHVCGVYTYISTCEDQRSAWWSQILFPTLIT